MRKTALKPLPKAPTGIEGLDEITGGGIPAGRPTLLCGSAGSGKSILGLEILFRGATQFGEPGVLISFEERPGDIAANVASLGFDVRKLIAERKLVIDEIRIDRSEIEETGEYNLDGLFIRLGHAIDSIGARRVMIDTIETLFSALTNQHILRAEIRRLFEWLKERNVTAVITGERGDGMLTRHGLEEYVSDCVILLDHRVSEQISTRRLRIVKYRGTTHGMNEYPFLIDENGVSVIPITSMGLDHRVSSERISTGIPKLDAMLGGRGVYRGSSILVSGTPGTGKSSISAHVASAACARGERCLYFAFEESSDQIQRNMRSIGIDFAPWLKKDLLRIHSSRPTAVGLEMHLALMQRQIKAFRPNVVFVDPINNLITTGSVTELRAMLTRLVDFLKSEGITAVLTSLSSEGKLEQTEIGLSSIMDTWILLRDIELGGERNRGLYILKSRGMAHSNQIREFIISNRGVDLVEVYLGPEGVLTGSARVGQEAREREAENRRREETRHRLLESGRRRAVLQAQLAALSADLQAEEAEVARIESEEASQRARLSAERVQLAKSRKAGAVPQDERIDRQETRSANGHKKLASR